ncbi:MAG TPA: AAA family ATPase [Burkholderiaceae bacterium]|nr:AAA family ATPase [Burkholderiaceae bacterium]
MAPVTEDNACRLAAHERLVSALLADPAAMAVPPQQRHRLQTAISSLVVAGDAVFKLRKPLRLDFLDFATPDRRRDDCLDELRLNRRTAPQVYVDVLPITGTPEAPRLGGNPARAIDWALRMRRFDDTQRLDRLAERGALDATTIDALAAALAAFHATLPPSPPAYGTPQAVRHWALENFDELAAGPAALSHAPRLRALRAWTEAETERLAPLLAARHRAGFVREGHGDLHLGNIVLVDGKPLPFDCLEFNAALRHSDVMADLAFAFMDLQRHGLAPLAWRLASTWAEHSGDHAGLAALHFFAVYRALVRAKVALLRAAQHDAQAQAAFERDLALAERLAAPRAGPLHLVITSGVSGSGKSTLAQALVEALGAIRLRSDVERKRLYGVALTARPDAAQAAVLYSREATERTYARLGELAAALLDAGLPVIVDAAFLRRAERDAIRTLGMTHGARVTLVECHAPEAMLAARVRERLAAERDASDATPAVLAQQLRWREPADDDEQPLRLATEAPPQALVAAVRAALGIA